MGKSRKKRGKPETVIVFSAHTDDFVLGAGGTIAKYRKEGKKVVAIVFSLGEMSHPWMKKHIIKKIRAEETKQASTFLGCKVVICDLRDQHIAEDYLQQQLTPRLIRLLQVAKPTKIFTHSHEDLHPDHRAVYRITVDLLALAQVKPEVYMYSIWNPVSLRTDYPTLYVDTHATFFKKLKAIRLFHSQQIHISYPVFLLLFHNLRDGLRIRRWCAEKFFRIR